MINKNLNLFDSVRNENSMKISTEILEAGIDILSESEIIKDIPILGIYYKAFSAVQKIEDYRFTKKILKFLFELKTIDLKTKEKFIEKIEANDSEKDVGEKLLLIIHRLDEINKATIIGKLFLATIGEQIELNDFLRLSRIVEQTFLEDLLVLRNNKILYNVSNEIKLSLYQGHLLNQKIKDNRERENILRKKYNSNLVIPPKFEYELNKYGEILIDYGL